MPRSRPSLQQHELERAAAAILYPNLSNTLKLSKTSRKPSNLHSHPSLSSTHHHHHPHHHHSLISITTNPHPIFIHNPNLTYTTLNPFSNPTDRSTDHRTDPQPSPPPHQGVPDRRPLSSRDRADLWKIAFTATAVIPAATAPFILDDI